MAAIPDVTTWSWRNCSSAAFSIVTIRSSSGMNDESTLSIVVLPEPVPPETTMLSRASTQALRNVAISGVKVPKRIRSSTVKRILGELTDRDGRTVERDRRNDGVDAGTIGQAGVDRRRRFVDATAERRNDAVDDAHDVLVVIEHHIGKFQACRAARRRPALGR